MSWIDNFLNFFIEVEVPDESIRPWGHYDILYDDDDCKVKRIVIKQCGKLSYQLHQKRTEDWVVISGHGLMTLDGKKIAVSPGSVIHIGTDMKHRIQNTGTANLVFIEVQTGIYFGEDDIVRIDDIYGR